MTGEVVGLVRHGADAAGIFFFSSRRRHTSSYGDWSSDVCSSDLASIARSRLKLGEEDAARLAAEEVVEIMEARGLAACALSAPIALAEVLIATEGAGARSEERRVGKECGCRWSAG